MRTKIILPALFLCIFGALILTGCSKSDDQKKFENEAFKPPNKYTETLQDGSIKNEDPDDWRISPRYSGLITIGEPLTELPHPNPVLFNSRLTIDIYLRSIETLSAIEIYLLDLESSSNPLRPLDQRTVSSGQSQTTFTLSGELISGSTGGSDADDLYRILIYDDGRRNLITYGDVKVE
ncbi:hypothetical protein [Fodinibius salsisoli]|uniref:Lipoprotein n=1 Tax=Fodinibius salsisoli TaxID=2820877 RepID=A0ABT3PIT2_9BACT|nr:hypothetical protein [Fodinibius salsisoli]MCW9705827.1 hypothetical protein [Fodinibius salsisoli]